MIGLGKVIKLDDKGDMYGETYVCLWKVDISEFGFYTGDKRYKVIKLEDIENIKEGEYLNESLITIIDFAKVSYTVLNDVAPFKINPVKKYEVTRAKAVVTYV